jgi:hypothetical protein
VGMVGAHEGDVEHPVELHVVHEEGPAGEQARVLVPADAAAHVVAVQGTSAGREARARSAASRTAWTMFS